MRRTAFSLTDVASSSHFVLIACTAAVTTSIALPARAADANPDSLQLEEVVVGAHPSERITVAEQHGDGVQVGKQVLLP